MDNQTRALLSRLMLDDEGQDLVEYALLTAIIALTGMAVFGALRDTMADAYQSWTSVDEPTSIQGTWVPPPPGS